MVNFITPEPQEQPKPPKQIKHPPPEIPHTHLAAEAPVVSPDEPVVYVPPPPPQQPVAATEAPQVPSQLPSQPVMLSSNLSVACPERSAPDYPLPSKWLNEQGKVVLRVELGEDGRVANAVVKTSSGYPRLDEASLNAVNTWRCTPSIHNGVAVRAIALQPFNFTLERS